MSILERLGLRKKETGGERQFATAINTMSPVDFPFDGEGRPWGGFVNLAEGGQWHVKILEIGADKRLSLQSHNKREEYMIILDGDATLIAENDQWQMAPNTMYHIPVGAKHRLASMNGARVLEVSRGEFDENDITRYEDDHGRVS